MSPRLPPWAPAVIAGFVARSPGDIFDVRSLLEEKRRFEVWQKYLATLGIAKFLDEGSRREVVGTPGFDSFVKDDLLHAVYEEEKHQIMSLSMVMQNKHGERHNLMFPSRIKTSNYDVFIRDGN